MTCVKEIYDFIDSLAPFDTQESWDNSGFLVGDINKPCKKIAFCLDITGESVRLADEAGADLIISHHPVIFGAKKSFLAGEPAYELAKRGIAAVCAHTCLDKARGGVNDVLIEALGLKSKEITCEEEFLRFAELENEMSEKGLALYIKDRLGCENVRYCEVGKMIKTVAVCSGSGADFIENCVGKADALITGDAGHHDFLDALQEGIALFAAGHFETENPVIPVLEKIIKSKFSNIETVILKQDSPVKNA